MRVQVIRSQLQTLVKFICEISPKSPDPPPQCQDLSNEKKKTVIHSKHTHHDWPVKKAIVHLSITIKGNSNHALVIC